MKSLGHTLHLDAAIEASINVSRSRRLFFPPDTPDWLRQLQTYGIFALNRRPSLQSMGEGSRTRREMTEAMSHSGGVVSDGMVARMC